MRLSIARNRDGIARNITEWQCKETEKHCSDEDGNEGHRKRMEKLRLGTVTVSDEMEKLSRELRCNGKAERGKPSWELIRKCKAKIGHGGAQPRAERDGDEQKRNRFATNCKAVDLDSSETLWMGAESKRCAEEDIWTA